MEKYQSCEFRPGSFTGDARLVTDIKYINKNLHKLTQAMPIEILYFLYLAFTDYYLNMPCIRQITQIFKILIIADVGHFFQFIKDFLVRLQDCPYSLTLGCATDITISYPASQYRQQVSFSFSSRGILSSLQSYLQ